MHPFYPSVELDNQSYFRQCIFETDNNHEYYYPPNKHVVMKEVKGIVFKACDFKGSDPEDMHYKADQRRGYGIYSVGSAFSTDYLCTVQYEPCPDTSRLRCTFNNLNYGIYALEWNTTSYISVSNTNFVKNYSSIYISGTSNSSIIQCSFNIKKPKKTDTTSGIYLDNCTGYQIEENTFTSYYNPNMSNDDTTTQVGLYIKNSGTANNEIYNNYFNNNYYATIVEGVNRGDTTGLCIKCNDYRYNMNDIFVVPDTSLGGLPLEQGIAEYQGSATDTTTTGPAGNTFTVFEDDPDTVKIKYFNYLNDTTEYFNYLYHDYSIEYPRIYPKNVNDSTELIIFHYMNLLYIKEESCPSSFNGGSIEDLKYSIDCEEERIGQLKSNLYENVDGGSTSELLDDIDNSNPSQSKALRQQLIEYSPYLSDTVVSLCIEKESVLPNPFLRDIMKANPHAARKEKHFKHIDKRNIKMPVYMKEQIREAKYSLDAFDLLKSEKQLRENKKDKYLNAINRCYLSDTSFNNTADSIILSIKNELSMMRKLQISYAYFSQGDTLNARNSINSISSELNLNATEDSIVSGFSKLMDILIAQKADEISNLSLDSNEIAELHGIRTDKLPLISVYAENLLAANKKLLKKETYYFPSSTNHKSREIAFPGNEPEIHKEYLKLIPNPTNSSVLVDYEIDDLPDYNLILRVFNVNGIEIYSAKLNYQKGQHLLNVNSWQPGIYIVSLKTNSFPLVKKLIKIN